MNSSAPYAADLQHPHLWGDVSYIVLGIIGAAANSLILAAIVMHRALRRHKEYFLLGLLVFFNAALCGGLTAAGVYRLAVSATPSHEMSQLRCLSLPHSLLFAGGPCVASVLLPFIAFDRLVAISRPLEYRAHEVYKGFVAVFALTFYIICFMFASNRAVLENKQISIRCDTRDVFSPAFKLFESICVVLCHALTVGLFLAVIGHFHCYAKQRPLRRESKSGLAAIRQQTRVMRTFAIFSSLTTVLVVLPFIIICACYIIIPSDSPSRATLDAIYLWVIKVALMNPTINVVVYALRHNEIYVGVRSLLLRQPTRLSNGACRVRELLDFLWVAHSPGQERLHASVTHWLITEWYKTCNSAEKILTSVILRHYASSIRSLI